MTDILSVKSVSPVSLIASPPFNKIVPVRLEADGLLDVALTANISFSPVASVPETGVTPFHANQSPHSEANVAAQGNPFVALKVLLPVEDPSAFNETEEEPTDKEEAFCLT